MPVMKTKRRYGSQALRGLGHEDEAEIRVAGLEGAVEVAHDVAEHREGRILVHHVQQGCVVFVDEHDHFLSGLPVCGLNQIFQSEVRAYLFWSDIVFFLVIRELVSQHCFQLLFLRMLGHTHVEVQHRIHRPVLFKRLYGQPLEQLPPSLEITVEGGYQQRLSEPPRAAEEDVLCPGVGHAVHVFGLVDVQVILIPYIRECLYAYRVESLLCVHGHACFRFRLQI